MSVRSDTILSVGAGAALFVMSAITLGAFDSTNPVTYINFNFPATFLTRTIPPYMRYYYSVSTGSEFYQLVLLTIDAGLAYLMLYNKNWTPRQNMINLTMTVPHAIIMDVSSIWFSSGASPFPIPQNYFLWRDSVFHGTGMMSVINWVNEPSNIIPGAIQGYDLIFPMTATYVGLCYMINSNRTFSFIPGKIASYRSCLSFNQALVACGHNTLFKETK